MVVTLDLYRSEIKQPFQQNKRSIPRSNYCSINLNVHMSKAAVYIEKKKNYFLLESALTHVHNK